MATSQVSGVIQHLRRAVLLRDGAGLTDGQLLESYISRREEAALAVLVRRHGPMVWGVCRRILHNEHDAEDAFQATFLVLVRRAASVVPREMVANWLHGVARQTAWKARTTAAKRMERERQVTEMPEPAVAEQDFWHDVRPLLDQELGRLPKKHRAVIVLCDLEGKTRKEAARQLGVPEGTIAGWLARARRMLARRFGRQGVVLSAGVLATVISQNTASAGVPVYVLSSTIKAATLLAAGQAATAGVISLRVAALTEGVLKAMVLSKAKLALCAVLAIGLLISGWGIYGTQAAPRSEQPVARADQPAPTAAAKEKEVPLATTPAPVQVLASISKDKKLVVKTNAEVPGEGAVLFGEVKVGGFVPPGPPPAPKKLLLPVIFGELRTRTYDLDKVEVFDTKGKKLDSKEVMKRLREETLALASLHGEPVEPQHLRLIKDGTLIFVLPAPKAGPGAPAPGFVPGAPGVLPIGPAVPAPGPQGP
jgi:RNA polymerase sigma factor (sigma-70 family)